MKILYRFVLFIVFGIGASGVRAQNDFDLIQDQIFSNFQGNINTVTLDASVAGLLNLLQANGSYSDITYTDQSQTTWKPGDHLSRMATLSKAYSNPGSSYYNDPALLNSIVLSMNYWLGLSPAPSSTNWYFYAISVPKDIGNTLISLRKSPDGISSSLENDMIQWMVKGIPITTSPSKDGSNLIDVATHYIMRASLLRDGTLMNQAVSAVANSIEITTGEGIQIDNSFRAHGAQLYTYGYGSVYISGITSIARYLVNTSYEIPASKIAIISDFIRNGFIQASRGKHTDFNVYNRGISRPGAGKAEVGQIERFKTVDIPLHSAYYDQVIDRMKGTVSPGHNVIANHTHYWRSDYTVHHRPGYMLGLRSVSNRTVKAENGNGENLKGYYMTEGVTCIAVNGNEYDGIYPVWDWNKLPGITVPELASFPLRTAWGANPGTASFVGGVSDGLYGVSAFAMNDYSTTAKKAWFFFDDEVVSLGADITSTAAQPVNTTINQNLRDGDITIKTSSGLQTLSEGLTTYADDLQWVFHDSVGYFFPDGGTVSLQNQPQTGTQQAINSSYSNDLITKDIFKLWFPHGVSPSKNKYAYIIVPGLTDLNALDAYDPGQIEILANSDSIQAVRHTGLNIWQVVFYKKCTFSADGITVTADKPSTLILKSVHTSEVEIYAADPTQNQKQLTIGLETPLIQNMRQLKLSLPVESLAGSSVSGVINPASEEYVEPEPEVAMEIKAVADAYVRDGSYSETNYGSVTAMPVKNDGIGYARQIFLKFDPAATERPVSKARLRMYVTSANTTAHTTQWAIYKTATSDWEENTINWHNKPAAIQPVAVASGINTSGFVEWDITQAFNMLQENELLSFQLVSTLTGSTTDASFASKENANGSYHPVILLENKPVNTEEILPVADSWVRSGAHAGKNYGAAGYMVARGGGADINNSYLQFDLKGHQHPVVDATLRLYNQSDVNTTWTIRSIQDHNWAEGNGNFEGNSTEGITWNNAPTAGTNVTSYSGETHEGYVHFDVSALMESLGSDSLITLQVSSSADVYSSFASRNNNTPARRPVLILNTLEPEPLTELLRIPVVADAFVRGGDYQADNYGTSNVLTIKNELNETYAREVYLKADIPDITEDIRKIILRLYVTYAGATITTTTWDLYNVTDASWEENSIRWNSKPSAGSFLSSAPGAPAGSYVDFDITAYIKSLLSQSGLNQRTLDELVAFKIVSSFQGSTTDASFASRENSNQDFRPQIIVFGEETPMPVTYLYFKGKRQDTGAVQLDWATTTEQNHRYFEIERSENGIRFNRIGTVEKPDFTQAYNLYSFPDTEFAKSYPYPLFYRIRQIDLNGTFEYSPIISVAGDKNAKITFGPNPSSGRVTLMLPSQPEIPLEFRLINQNGNIIQQLKLKELKYELELSSYPRGLYSGVIQHIDGSIETLKIILN